MSGLWFELKRRNVFRVAVLYLVAAWLILQIADVLFGLLEVPGWSLRFVLGLLVLGFPVAVALSWIYELTPEGIRRESELDRSESISAKTGQRLNLVTIAVVSAAAALLVLDRWVGRDDNGSEFAAEHSLPAPATVAAGAKPGSDGTAPDPADVSDKSVAVLPFANLSSDEENAYFASGVHEDVLTYLAKVRDLRVISRTTMLRYSDRGDDISAIAAELDVRYVLEGSVRRAGDRVRVTAQLIDGRSDEHVWAENYDRSLDDVFAIQSDIAKEIAAAMQAQISPAEQVLIERRPTDNVAAYELYVAAREAIWHPEYGRDIFERAGPLLEAALELDPDFALARVLYAYVQGQFYWLGKDDGKTAKRAEEAVARARALQPDLPEVVAAEGEILYRIHKDFPGALAKFEQAQQRLPNDSLLLMQTGWAQRRLNLWDQAIASMQRAAALDPANLQIYTNLAETATTMGDGELALRVLDKGLEVASGTDIFEALKADVYLRFYGDLEAAASLVEKVDSISASVYAESLIMVPFLARDYSATMGILEDPLFEAAMREDQPLQLETWRGVVFTQLGQTDAARREFETVVAMATDRPFVQTSWDSYQALALAHAYLGNRDETLAALETMIGSWPENDVLNAGYQAATQVEALTRIGEHEQALDILEARLGIPAGFTIWDLRLDPRLDPLRDNPRFRALVAD
jgi:TolB-like protein/tetratricopeptide (TPR) repeat protein